jgi:hypothetical protein
VLHNFIVLFVATVLSTLVDVSLVPSPPSNRAVNFVPVFKVASVGVFLFEYIEAAEASSKGPL